MKPILVDSCNNYDHGKHSCSKCGRSLPDVCLEFEQMKAKADEYDAITRETDNADTSATIDAPVAAVKPKGRPRAKNAAD